MRFWLVRRGVWFGGLDNGTVDGWLVVPTLLGMHIFQASFLGNSHSLVCGITRSR